MLRNSELVTLQSDLAKLREQAARLIERLDETMLNQQPGSDEWSVGQQLDHLNKIAAAFLPTIEAAIGRLRSENKTAPGPFRYSLPERLLIRAMNPTGLMRKIMLPVPPMYEPDTAPLTLADLWAAFDGYQERLARALTEGDGLDLTAVRLPSPAASSVVVALGAWLHALIAHERYHLDKAAKVVEKYHPVQKE